jgi:hypothetical protein
MALFTIETRFNKVRRWKVAVAAAALIRRIAAPDTRRNGGGRDDGGLRSAPNLGVGRRVLH